MKRIALFGSNGYIGSQLLAYFAENGKTCDVFDIPSFDVTQARLWDSFVPSDYSHILFFAGMTGTEKSFMEAERFMDVNEYGMLHLLLRLSALGPQAPKIIFPSSRLVYKGANHLLTEDDPKEAKTVYAANKLACEYLLQAYHIRYGIPYVVARIGVPYGNIVSADYSYGTIGFFLKQAVAGGPVILYGDGSLRRTFTHVADICSAVYSLAQSSITGVFNVGGEDLSLLDAARVVAEKAGVEIKFVPWPQSALIIESGSTVFDSTKLQQIAGWRATKSLLNFAKGI